MKPQDIVFVTILIVLIFFRKPKLFEIIGLLCILLAIPLFSKWIFFTAQRLVMYGAVFIFFGAFMELMKLKRK